MSAAEAATSGAEADFGISTTEDRWIRTLVRVVNRISPRKPAQSFSEWTGLSLRQCENVLALRSGISLATLRRLLDTPHGWDFLAAFMAELADGPLPEWFLECRYLFESARLQADIAAARKALKDNRKTRGRYADR